ncbi:MAG TPA: lipopolysaccharide biosynthesis protein [Rhodospirillales bacterium]|nr:lipopolysaccharide biosynthesis protein [Rhodospirillales bacterium]
MSAALEPQPAAALAGGGRAADGAIAGAAIAGAAVAGGAVRRDAVVFFAGQLTATGCVWLLVLALARLGGPEPVGVFTFALALAAPIIVASQLGLRQLLNTDPRGLLRFDDFRRLRLALSLLAMAAIVAVGAALGYHGEALLVIALVAAAKAQDSIGDIYHALLQRAGRLDLAGISLALRGGLLLLLGGAGFALTQSMLAMAAGMALASAIVFGSFDRGVARATTGWRRRAGLRRSWIACRRLMWRAAPLAVSVVLININCNVPRYAVEAAMGPVGLGLYAAMDNIAAIGLLAVQSLGQSLFPRLADLWAAGDRNSFARLALRYVAVCAGIALLGFGAATVAGPWILHTLYGAAFAEAAPAFRFVMAAMIIAYVANALGHIITATGRFGPLIWPFAAVVAVTAAVAHLAVPAWGLTGAAIAVAGGHGVGILATTALLLHFARTQRGEMLPAT